MEKVEDFSQNYHYPTILRSSQLFYCISKIKYRYALKIVLKQTCLDPGGIIKSLSLQIICFSEI